MIDIVEIDTIDTELLDETIALVRDSRNATQELADWHRAAVTLSAMTALLGEAENNDGANDDETRELRDAVDRLNRAVCVSAGDAADSITVTGDDSLKLVTHLTEIAAHAVSNVRANEINAKIDEFDAEIENNLRESDEEGQE